MDDPYTGLRHNGQIEAQEVIVILVDGPGQGVLDRHYGRLHFLLTQVAEHVFKPHAGQHLHAAAEQPPRRFFAKGAALALKCRFLRSHSCYSTRARLTSAGNRDPAAEEDRERDRRWNPPGP